MRREATPLERGFAFLPGDILRSAAHAEGCLGAASFPPGADPVSLQSTANCTLRAFFHGGGLSLRTLRAFLSRLLNHSGGGLSLRGLSLFRCRVSCWSFLMAGWFPAVSLLYELYWYVIVVSPLPVSCTPAGAAWMAGSFGILNIVARFAFSVAFEVMCHSQYVSPSTVMQIRTPHPIRC